MSGRAQRRAKRQGKALAPTTVRSKAGWPAVCVGCGASFVFEVSDIRERGSVWEDDDVASMRGVNCPRCSAWIRVIS